MFAIFLNVKLGYMGAKCYIINTNQLKHEIV